MSNFFNDYPIDDNNMFNVLLGKRFLDDEDDFCDIEVLQNKRMCSSYPAVESGPSAYLIGEGQKPAQYCPVDFFSIF